MKTQKDRIKMHVMLQQPKNAGLKKSQFAIKCTLYVKQTYI